MTDPRQSSIPLTEWLLRLWLGASILAGRAITAFWLLIVYVGILYFAVATLAVMQFQSRSLETPAGHGKSYAEIWPSCST